MSGIGKRISGVGRQERAEPQVGERTHLRELAPTRAPCDACIGQTRRDCDARPHARLMIMNSGPLGAVFGGGVETRYVCLECGNIVIHSSGPQGFGWH